MTLNLTKTHKPHSNKIPNNTNDAIGVFDSGIGGLTILRCIEELLPNEHLIYFADNEYAPYGEKSPELIIERVNKIAEYFMKQNVKAIVIACNTATAVAIDQLRANVNIPIIGVEPAVKPAVLSTKKQKVAILTTQATAENERFNLLVKQHSANANVFIQPCPGLVEQIEQGQLTSEETQTLLIKYLSPLQKKGIDTLVLGCTHYPMLKNTITKVLGNDVELIDTGLPVAIQLKHVLQKAHLLNITVPDTLQSNQYDDHVKPEQLNSPENLMMNNAQYQWRSSKPLSNPILKMFPYSWQLSNL